MSARTHTPLPPLYRDTAEAIALAQDVNTPERLELFLQSIRARLEIPIPAPTQPISIEIP